jgi:teichoic acid ribitol-phosphate primase
VNAFVALRMLLVRLGFAVGRLRPVRSRVVLATSHATAIGGNLAWIRAGLRASRPEVAVTELAYRVGGGRRRHLGAAWHSLLAGYHLATARLFVVDDYFFPMYVIRPRAGTTFVQAWHACGAFKKFGYSVVDKAFGADEAYAEAVRIHSTYDVCLVSSERFVPAYAEAFRLPPERFTSRLGIPRTDLFFDAARVAATVDGLRRRYGIPSGKRVVLYAPTFRGDRGTRARDPEGLDLAALQPLLGEGHVVLLRSHPFVRERSGAADRHAGFAIDVSDHPDMNELLLVADVLVTDYSSAMFEFALL